MWRPRACVRGTVAMHSLGTPEIFPPRQKSQRPSVCVIDLQDGRQFDFLTKVPGKVFFYFSFFLFLLFLSVLLFLSFLGNIAEVCLATKATR